ncbi:hypothetical protein M408DRAFT_296787 [Serendipita vermifera MAFF 305830]|uniref:Uncharacterized protein n=1 Tax=Serendipita vermifera MAFF 305830 TaxID=933852 RepID=A0A0C3BDV3_SERVB|nr:hypothetical protein M408DRAFT_296787 [Serendipita vermifera MAFF 305830]
MFSSSSKTPEASSNVPNGLYTNILQQEAPQGSINSPSDKMDESPIEKDMSTRISDNAASSNASVLPQRQTLLAGGTTSRGTTPTNASSRPELRLALTNPLSAAINALSAFAHHAPQSANTSPPFSGNSKRSHGIASALGGITSFGMTIGNPDGSRASQPHSPPSASQPGLFQGLAMVGGFSAITSAAGTDVGNYNTDATKATAMDNIHNTPPSDPGHHSSFSDLQPSMSMSDTSGMGTHRMDTSVDGDEEDEDDAVFPLSNSHSPYLHPRSRPMSPHPDAIYNQMGGGNSPSANILPPHTPSPYASPGLSPLALAPSPGPYDGGSLSPGAHSPGGGSCSGLEGEAGGGASATSAPVSPTSPGRGRLRGRVQSKGSRPSVSPHHPYSASAGSTGNMQQAQFVRNGIQGVSPSPSRRSDAVESRYARHRGNSVGTGYTAGGGVGASGGGSRGTSPYPTADGMGMMPRRQSASASESANHFAMANAGMRGGVGVLNVRPFNNASAGGSPASVGVPPLEIQGGSASPSRDASPMRDPSGAYGMNPQPLNIPPSYAAHYLGAPQHSPNSPGFTGYTTVVPHNAASPVAGNGGAVYYSPHLQSPHSLSPHSGAVPSLTPSPENSVPNVSNHPSPALGFDPAGTVASNELLFLMDLPQAASQNSSSGMMVDGNNQYSQGGYPDPMWAASQQQGQMTNTGVNQNWMGESGSTGLPLTTQHVEAMYGASLGHVESYPATNQPALSVRADNGTPNDLDVAAMDPVFWTGSEGLNPQPQVNNQATSGSAEWGAMVDPNQHSSSPRGALNSTLAPGMQDQSVQVQQQQYFNMYEHQQGQHHFTNQTVPPSPAKGTVLPWQDGQLPPGGLEDWQQRNYAMQMHAHTPQESIHQVLANPVNPNEGMLVPPRPKPRRQRSKSDSYGEGHYPSYVPSYPTGPPPAHMIDNSMAYQQQPPTHTYNDPGFVDENTVLGSGTGANLKNTKSLPIPAPRGGQYQHQHRRTPTIAVTDHDAHLAHQVMSRSYQGRSNMQDPMALLSNNSDLLGISGSSSNAQPQPPSFTHSHTHPNGVPHYPGDMPLAGPSTLLRTTSIPKRKQQGQRNEVDEEKLANAFLPGSHRPDPALRFFLEAILNSQFYRDDILEPLLGTPDAEYLLGVVRARFPRDLRFSPRATIGHERGVPDNEKRDSQSIYMLFTEGNNCLICGKGTDRAGRALGHVRSDIGHRPYHCHCEKCLQSPKYVLFPSV